MILNKTISALLLAGMLIMTGCTKNEYYSTDPVQTQPVGYQYSFNDDFDRDIHNWSFSDPANEAYVSVGGGTLQYIYDPVNGGTNTVAVQTGASMRNNFLIQSKVSADNAMGIAFGVSDNNYGYSFMIDDQGYFALYKEGSAGVQATAIIDWKASNAILKGWNEIELEQVGDYWLGYANGSKLFEVPAQYLSGSKIGFIVLSGTQGHADYLTVQW